MQKIPFLQMMSGNNFKACESFLQTQWEILSYGPVYFHIGAVHCLVMRSPYTGIRGTIYGRISRCEEYTDVDYFLFGEIVGA